MPTGLYFAAMNYSVHAVMYFYYFLAGAVGPRFPADGPHAHRRPVPACRAFSLCDVRHRVRQEVCTGRPTDESSPGNPKRQPREVASDLN